jgi:hypothetical protein
MFANYCLDIFILHFVLLLFGLDLAHWVVVARISYNLRLSLLL